MEYLLLLLLPIPPIGLSITLLRGNDARPEIDLGIVFAWIVFLYAWLPLLGIILAENGYGEINERRFNNMAFSVTDAVDVALCYLAFLAGFTMLYKIIRAQKRTPVVYYLKPAVSQITTMATVFLIVLSTRFLLSSIYALDVNADYAESYTQYRLAPILLQQFTGFLNHFEITLTIASIVYLIMWKPQLHIYVAMVTIIMLTIAVFSGESRTIGFLSAFAYVVTYSLFVKNLTRTSVTLLIGAGLFLFTLAGILRSDANHIDVSFLRLIQEGEMLNLFVNALDLNLRTEEVGQRIIDWRIYFVDLVRWIPQQLLWFEKIDLAAWYVQNYYPDFYYVGGGLAFGAISESVIGFGSIEAFVRGGLLGVVFAMIANFCLSGRVSPLKALTYVWFIVMSYQSVRDTTFTVLARYVLHVVPLILVLMYLKRIAHMSIGDDLKEPRSGKSNELT